MADISSQEGQEEKKKIVLQKVISLCRASLPSSGMMRQIGDSLNNGEQLDIEILSGGLTNYSYKLYLPKDHRQALYAKLSFEHAFWNPDKSRRYDLARTENEFKMMEMFSQLHPDMIAKPLSCEDIVDEGKDGAENMKLMITEWCENDEQLANQFIDGIVDPRLVPQIAKAIATLHCQDFDPAFNDDVRDYVLTAFTPFREHVVADATPSTDHKAATRTELLCQEIGKEELLRIVDRIADNYHERECLIHGDNQVFNIIVERKPSIASLERFGKEGCVTVVDWEMAMAGPAGKDHGQFYAFPIACAIMHALNGNQDLAQNMTAFLDQHWETYVDTMCANEKGDNTFLTKLFHDTLAYTGWLMYLGYYSFRCHIDHLPIHDGSPEDAERVRDAVGLTGIRLMRLAFGDRQDGEEELTLEELRQKYQELITQEIDTALQVSHGRRKGRRTSMLRASGRRVSDASLNFPEVALARLSISHGSRGYSSGRASVVLKEILLLEEEEEDTFELV